MKKTNEMVYTPEEVEKGLHLDLISTLLKHNSCTYDYYNDIHITTDGYCTIVEWEHLPHGGEYGGKFVYVGEDETVVKILEFPDKHIEYVDEKYEDCDEMIKEWLEKNPGWSLDTYGNWVFVEGEE